MKDHTLCLVIRLMCVRDQLHLKKENKSKGQGSTIDFSLNSVSSILEEEEKLLPLLLF